MIGRQCGEEQKQEIKDDSKFENLGDQKDVGILNIDRKVRKKKWAWERKEKEFNFGHVRFEMSMGHVVGNI